MANGYQKYLSGEANPRNRISNPSAFVNDIDMEGYDEAQYEKDLADIRDLNDQITKLTQDINEYEGRVKFHKENASDPFYRSALLHFMETGDSGPMTAYKAQKEQAAQRKAIEEQNKIEREKAANIEIQSAKDNIDQALEIMKDRNYAGTPEYNAAKKQYNEAQNILKNRYGIDYKGSAEPKPKAKVPESKLKIDVLSDAEDYIEGIYEGDVSTIKEDLRALFKEYPNDTEIRNLYRKVRTAEREAPFREAYYALLDEKPVKFKDEVEKGAYKAKVNKALSDGKISNVLADKLLSDVNTSKSLEQENIEEEGKEVTEDEKKKRAKLKANREKYRRILKIREDERTAQEANFLRTHNPDGSEK